MINADIIQARLLSWKIIKVDVTETHN